MKVVKRTGLVPVLMRQSGVTQGVLPDLARKLVAAKEAILVDPPSWVETYEIADKVKPAVKAVSVEHAVAIPEEWEGMHHLQRIKLAMALGDLAQNEGERKIDAADRLIREEVQRRAAAVNAQAE